jgi:glucose uptake protein GlcU
MEASESFDETLCAYLAIILAVLIFGTNFIPVKKIATGDGLFFQLIVCVHIWLVGLIICFFRSNYVLHPLPMLGGCLWATGNLCKVPIIKTVGLGIGQVVWAGTNCLFGWSIARFGLFGGESQQPSNVWLNYIGVGLTTFSLIIFSLVDSHGKTQADIKGNNYIYNRSGY